MGIRHYPDLPRIYIDMDGVTADFERMAGQMNLVPATLKRVAGAYANLEPFPGALEAICKIEGGSYLVFFLTKIPSSNPYAATEKLLWMRQHLPEFADRVIITPDKGCVGTSRDYLIDDHPEWANANNFPGTIIHFKGDWIETLKLLNIQ